MFPIILHAVLLITVPPKFLCVHSIFLFPTISPTLLLNTVPHNLAYVASKFPALFLFVQISGAWTGQAQVHHQYDTQPGVWDARARHAGGRGGSVGPQREAGTGLAATRGGVGRSTVSAAPAVGVQRLDFRLLPSRRTQERLGGLPTTPPRRPPTKL